MDRREIKLALINSGLINQDGWISTGTESSDFNDEFEQAINNIQSLFNSERLKWNKEMRERKLNIEKIKEIMREDFEARKEELEAVKYRSETRAFAVAGIDLIYNFMQRVLKKLELLEQLEEEK